VGDWGRTTGKRSKTQEKKKKVHRGGEFIGRKESETIHFCFPSRGFFMHT
jgi:hypothetical protein